MSSRSEHGIPVQDELFGARFWATPFPVDTAGPRARILCSVKRVLGQRKALRALLADRWRRCPCNLDRICIAGRARRTGSDLDRMSNRAAQPVARRTGSRFRSTVGRQ